MTKLEMRELCARAAAEYNGIFPITRYAPNHRCKPRQGKVACRTHRAMPMWQRLAIVNQANWR